MKISYKKLWHLLIDKNMNKGDLQRIARISSTSIAKLSKGDNLQTEVLVKICAALNCDTSDIMEFEPSIPTNNTIDSEVKKRDI